MFKLAAIKLFLTDCFCACACVSPTANLPLGAAGNITCGLAVENTGTVRLRGMQLQGPENNCSMIDVQWPGQNITGCAIKLHVDQAAFDAREANELVPDTTLNITVQAIGYPNVTNTTAAQLDIPVPAVEFTGLVLPIFRNMSVTASLGKTMVNLTGVSWDAYAFILTDEHADCFPAFP